MEPRWNRTGNGTEAEIVYYSNRTHAVALEKISVPWAAQVAIPHSIRNVSAEDLLNNGADVWAACGQFIGFVSAACLLYVGGVFCVCCVCSV